MTLTREEWRNTDRLFTLLWLLQVRKRAILIHEAHDTITVSWLS